MYSSFRYIVILKYLLPFAESFTGDTQWMNPVTMVTGLSDGGGFSSIFLFFSEDVILASWLTVYSRGDDVMLLRSFRAFLFKYTKKSEIFSR